MTKSWSPPGQPVHPVPAWRVSGNCFSVQWTLGPSEAWLVERTFGHRRSLLFLTLLFVVLDIPNRLKHVWELEFSFPKMQILLPSPSEWWAGWSARVVSPLWEQGAKSQQKLKICWWGRVICAHLCSSLERVEGILFLLLKKKKGFMNLHFILAQGSSLSLCLSSVSICAEASIGEHSLTSTPLGV